MWEKIHYSSIENLWKKYTWAYGILNEVYQTKVLSSNHQGS